MIRVQHEPQKERSKSLFESFFDAWEHVEHAIEEIVVAPVVEAVRGVYQDFVDLTTERADKDDQELSRAPLRLQALTKVFVSSTRQDQLRDLADSGAPQRSPEENAARQQLAIASGAVVANVLGVMTASTGLLFIGVLGLFYQLPFLLRAAYDGVVKERRLNVFAQDLLITAVAVVGGSITAVTVGMFSGSLLRWLIAKTEGIAQHSISTVFSRQPKSVWLVSGDTQILVPFEQIRPGDRIVVRNGEMIPVDGTVFDGTGSVDQRMLTGEARPVDVGPGDPVRASCVVLAGQLSIEVEHSGQDTVAAQLARVLADTSEYKRELWQTAERRADGLAIPFLLLSAVALPIWGLDTALGVFWALPGFRMMFFGPLTMLSFMHVASQHGILLKSSQPLKRLRDVDTVVFDKTGTLTMEQPTVGQIFGYGGWTSDKVLAIAATAEFRQTHPIALAIQALAQEKGISPSSSPDTDLSVGFGVHVTVEGERFTVGSQRLMALCEVEIPIEVVSQQEAAHDLGRSFVFVARGKELIGAIEICPSVRPEAGKLVSELVRRGKQVVILSGDHEGPTRALAAQMGIERYFSQVLPEEKSKFVEKLQDEGHIVCFIGDGINDSMALKKADVSISLKGATSIATTVAQVVFMSGNLQSLIKLFDMADGFEHYMRVNRLATNLPSLVILLGTVGFGWSYLSAVLINQVSTPVALYSLFHPALRYDQLDSAQPDSAETAAGVSTSPPMLSPGSSEG